MGQISIPDLIKRWIFYNCPKDRAWIIYQTLPSILRQTTFVHGETTDGEVPSLESADQVLYVYSLEMDDKHLYCLLETTDGFWVIENHKIVEENVQKNQDGTNGEVTENVRIESTASYYPDIESVTKNATKRLLGKLQIIKVKNMKLNKLQRTTQILPYDFSQTDDRSNLLKQYFSQQQTHENVKERDNLDLGLIFNLTGEDLENFTPQDGHVVKRLTLRTNPYIRDFGWCQSAWAQGIETIDIVNMSHYINASLTKLSSSLPNLKCMRVHICPQINIRCLIGLLSTDQLEEISLNHAAMVCQPNAYSGLIAEEEWLKMGNRSIKRLLINSTNLSLDIIDYLRKCCENLEYLIVDQKVYDYFRQNLQDEGDPAKTGTINLVGNHGKKVVLGRDFTISNLLRQNFQKPFSDEMVKIMEKIHQQEELGISSESCTSESSESESFEESDN